MNGQMGLKDTILTEISQEMVHDCTCMSRLEELNSRIGGNGSLWRLKIEGEGYRMGQ